MQTSLGASVELTPGDIDEGRVRESQIVYIEGYLFGSPSASNAAIRAMELAQNAEVRVALSLSDPAMADSS